MNATTTKRSYTPAQLRKADFDDLIRDADAAIEQANAGRFYPERGITKDTLIAYAVECRENARLIAELGLS